MTKSFELVAYLSSTVYTRIPLSELLRLSQMDESDLEVKLLELPTHLYSYDHLTKWISIHPTVYKRNRSKQRRIDFVLNMIVGIGLTIPYFLLELLDETFELIEMLIFIILALVGSMVILYESWYFLGPGNKKWQELPSSEEITPQHVRN